MGRIIDCLFIPDVPAKTHVNRARASAQKQRIVLAQLGRAHDGRILASFDCQV
jgi:hypothetical protein